MRVNTFGFMKTLSHCARLTGWMLAVLALEDMGFTNVAHLEAGFKGWQEDGRDVEDVAATSRWVRR